MQASANQSVFKDCNLQKYSPDRLKSTYPASHQGWPLAFSTGAAEEINGGCNELLVRLPMGRQASPYNWLIDPLSSS